MPDWFDSNAPSAASAASKDDWFDLYSPSRKPVSAEDFAPETKPTPVLEQYGRFWKGVGSALDPRNLVQAVTHPIDTATNLANAHIEEMRKAGTALSSNDPYNRAHPMQAIVSSAGHMLAGGVPVLGPAAAAAGEQIASGDVSGGIGAGAGLVGSVVAPRAIAGTPSAVASAAPKLASIGEQLASKGKTLAPVAKEAAKIAVVEGGAHALGLPPVLASAARLVLRDVLDRVKRAPEAAEPAVSPNAGGTLVRDAAGAPVKAPDISSMLADSLAEIAAKKETPRITTPPQPELPAGYDPRTSAPKPKATRPPQATKPKPTASMGAKNYFLKKAEPSSEAADIAAPPRELELADLPTSWRGRTAQPLLKGVSPADLAKSLADELTSQGISAEDAISAVSKNKQLPPYVRIQLLDALNRTRRMVVQ